MKRGEVWLADLGSPGGGEQGGQRPVILIQHDPYTTGLSTVVIIPLTTNLRRLALPTCLKIAQGEGGLASDSVALCHQIRAIDKGRLLHQLGTLSAPVLADVEDCLANTLGM